MTEVQRSVNYRLLVPLMAHGLLVQVMIGMFRITTSYRVLELELPVAWVGLVATSFAIFPVFLAVKVGRYIDRTHDADAARIGSVLCVIASAGLLFFATTPFAIMGWMIALGIGHLFLMAAHQMLCVRAAGEHHRDKVFGNFLMMTGFGQGLGPLIVAWVGGDARVPDTFFLYSIGLAAAVAVGVIAIFLTPAKEAMHKAQGAAQMSLKELLRINGLVTVLIASVITMSAQDLIVVYLPLLGIERGIGVADIGMMLTVRSAAAVFSRIGYSQLIRAVGRVRLTFLTMCLAGLSFVLIVLPLALPLLYVAAFCLGLGLGLASALSLTSVVELAPASARATALSLRITGNRLGQASLPFIGSVLASAAGAAGVLGVIGICLIISGASVQVVRGRQGAS